MRHHKGIDKEADDRLNNSDLLTVKTVGPYLASRGLAEAGAPVEAAELRGGISNVVLAVSSQGLRAVVKQSLPKMRVADDWFAKRERTVTEARGLQLAGRIDQGSVPKVLDYDVDRAIVVIDRAPDGWRNYKEMLLAGYADRRIAVRCGEILGGWQVATHADQEIEESFNDLEAFDQQRIDPYYRTTAKRHPEVGETISEYAEGMAGRRASFTHGDFSPKNVLAGESDVWILDFEVAHFGDPAFDPAFMLNHFMLKAIHRSESSVGYRACATDFWLSYERRLHPNQPPKLEYVLGHVGCLMLARVDGKSPAEYLEEAGREHARKIAIDFLGNPPLSIDEAWSHLERSF